jgi:hypothetical protein
VPAEPYAAAPWKSEEAYYPVRWLKKVGRLPHEYKTWLGFGHSVPNGDPPRPLANGTVICGWVLLPPMTVREGFWNLGLPRGGRVDFFGMIGLLPDELEYKLRNGVDALFEGFDRHGVSELLAPQRGSSLAI